MHLSAGVLVALFFVPMMQAQYVQLNPTTSQTVSQPSGTTLAATSDNKHFNVSGFPSSCTTNEGSFTSQLECAWYTAYDFAVANTAQVELDMGYGYYAINGSLAEPTANFTGISLIGAGQLGSIVLANATMSDAVIYKNETAAGGTWPQLTFRGFKILGQDDAQGCMRLWGVQNLTMEHVGCSGIPNGAPFAFQFGEPSNYGQGWTFAVNAYDVSFANSVSDPNDRMTARINVSGGNITWPATITHGGSGYGASSVEQIYQGYIVGNQNGTSDKPCGTMPSSITVTVSGGAVTGFTGVGGSGCSGTITAMVLPVSNIATIFDIWSSDSMFKELDPDGGLTCITNHSGNVRYYGAHPTHCGIGIQSTGNVTYKDTEEDKIAKWGFDMLSGTSAEIDGTTTFDNFSAFNPFHLASNAVVQFGPQTNLCMSTSPVDYHEFLMPSGPLDGSGVLPIGTNINGTDGACSANTVGNYMANPPSGSGAALTIDQQTANGNSYIGFGRAPNAEFGYGNAGANTIGGIVQSQYELTFVLGTPFGSGLQVGGYSLGGFAQGAIGLQVASASSISPFSGNVFHVTGTATVNTIALPALGCATSKVSCSIALISDNGFSTGASGNIAVALTTVTGYAYTFTYDPATSKWYPAH
jgi:hypothetical protein